MQIFAAIKQIIPQPRDARYSYRMGYDCGKHGPNETNCHFGIFGTKENTRAWERGKADAEAGRLLVAP